MEAGTDMGTHGQEFVTVVIPAYNAAAWVGQTVASALAQTHRPLEVVVVDDGSTDGTADAALAAAGGDPRLRVMRQENRGCAAARNRGIREARGDLIAPLDADDLWHPEKLTRQVAALRRAGPRVGLVYAWSCSIDAEGRVIARVVPGHRHAGAVYPQLLLQNFISNGSAALFRRACFEETGGVDEDLVSSDDWALYLAVAERYELAVVPEFLVGYRQHEGGRSRRTWEQRRAHNWVVADARRRHPELPARLFRWSRGGVTRWLASRSRSAGRNLEWAALTALAALDDPGPVMKLLGQALGRRIFPRRPPPPLPPSLWHGRPFLTVPPQPGSSEPVSRTAHDVRRWDYIASVCVRRSN